MKVRCAKKEDIKQIEELYGLVSDTMQESAFDIGWKRDIYPSKEMIIFDINQETLYLLEKDEIVIGAVVLNHDYDSCYQNIYWQINAEDEEVMIMHRFCIHPHYRGCGKVLLKQIIHIAQKQNQKAIRLDVLSSNLPAIHLYEKCGFLLQGKQTMNYGKLCIACLYEKLL